MNTLLAAREALAAASPAAYLRRLADPAAAAAKDAVLAARQPSTAPGWKAVFAAARTGRVDRVAAALRAGFDVDTESQDGAADTLLTVAARHGHKRLLDLLLTRGANVNHQDAAGNCALHYCCDPGTQRLADPDGSVARYLLVHGAHAELVNRHGLTPFGGLRPGTAMRAVAGGLAGAGGGFRGGAAM